MQVEYAPNERDQRGLAADTSLPLISWGPDH